MDNAKTQGETHRIVDQWLAKGGLRPTRQRVILARRLIGDGKNRHVTAESLFAASNDHAERCLWPLSTIPCAPFVMLA